MKNEILNINEEIISKKKEGKFDIVIIGTLDNSLSRIFSIIINDPNIKHKYLFSYDLCPRDQIFFPKNFQNTFHPEILDKLMKIDILILTYENADFLSIENLKTFYHLYYKQLDEKDKPINILIIERNTNGNNIENKNKVDINDGKKIAELYSGLFCDSNINEEIFEKILIKCINNLKMIYDTENYNLFNHEIKEGNNINCNITVCGNNDVKNLFLENFLKLKCNEEYIMKSDNFFVINYKNEINNKEINWKINLELIDEVDYYKYSSQCYIFIYDKNKINTFNSIRDIIRSHILINGAKYKKIYKLISFTDNNFLEENDNDINEGKELAKEIGASYENINVKEKDNTNKFLDNLLTDIIKQMMECFENYKEKSANSEINKNTIIKSKTKNLDSEFYVLTLNDSPAFFIDDFFYKINNEIQNYTQEKFIFNLCPECYNYMKIIIDDNSNIIKLKCKNCNTESYGLNYTQYVSNKKDLNKKLYCDKCYSCLYYDYSLKKLLCQNCQYNYKKLKNVSIPVFLKDYYCENHNKFYEYYLKYSKKGLCNNCINDKYKKGYFLSKFKEDEIKQLIKDKKVELEKEKNFFISLKNKFKKCIKDLEIKFDELMIIKKSIYDIKKEIIKNLEYIEKSYTLISNVKNLQFNFMKKFDFPENGTIENKLKTIFNFFNNEEDINNLYFDKRKEEFTNFKISGPYKNLVEENIEKNKDNENTNVTDICSFNNNQLLCISFNDGKVKIFDSNIKKGFYPLCIINEYEPLLGVNSIYISKNKENKEIIYLCGYENIKALKLKNDYKSYDVLYTINLESVNISQLIELSFEKSLIYLNKYNEIIVLNFDKNDIDNKIGTNVTNLFIKEEEKNNQIFSMNKIGNNIISIHISNKKEKILLQENVNDANLDCLTLVFNDNNNIADNEEKQIKNFYNKIYKIDYKQNINKEKENKYSIVVLKEYKIPYNYELLGVLSEEENLFLMSLKKEDENSFNPHLCIFDFSICQFIKSFKFHNNFAYPKLFIKIKFEKNIKNEGFIVCDENLNLTQYFYDKDSKDMIYYVKIIEAKKKMYNMPLKLIYLEQNIIIFCNKNNYYLLSD